MKKRLLSGILCICMVFALLPATATAADGVQMLLDVSNGNITITSTGFGAFAAGGSSVAGNDTDGYIITGTTTEYSVSVESGEHNITLRNASIDASAKVSTSAFAILSGATVNMTLDGTNTLKGGGQGAGLHVPAGATLTITGQDDGSGSLSATSGSSGGAGIGGSFSSSACGTVNINGGTVEATGMEFGAGIGGGGASKVDMDVSGGAGGTVNISGGTVRVNASGNGAGIGGGAAYSSNGTALGGAGGTVNISGGTVTANGFGYGAGIGGGGASTEVSDANGGAGGTVNISGGTVNATTTHGDAAGIGGGGATSITGNVYAGAGGAVIISGGNVKATGGSTAIGSGGGSDNGTLTNGGGSPVNVYLTTLTLSGTAVDAFIASINRGSYAYGLKDVKPIDNKLYFYLPEGTALESLTTGESLPRVFASANAPITVQSNHSTAGTLTQVANAIVDDVTVSGTQGTEISSASVVVRLTGESFKAIPADTDASVWFDNLPSGLAATVSSAIAENDTSASFTLSGTPDAAYSSALALTIPAEYLVGSPALTVTPNEFARWAIASAQTPASQVTLYNDTPSSKATIWLTGFELDSGDQLITERDPEGSAYKAMKKLADSDDVFAAYNIYLRSGRKSTSSAMSITFNLDAKYAGQQFTLVHQKADGTYEYFYAAADANGDLTFGPLYGLSPFMLVKGTLNPNAISVPNTADSARSVLWSGIALAACASLLAGLALYRRQRIS